MTRLKITIYVSSAVLALLMLSSDSPIFAPSQILTHFQHNQSYPYLAARNGHSPASWFLYQRDREPQWLKLAAQQGHREAAFLWYQKDPKQRRIWLNHAADLGHAEAIKTQIEGVIAQKQWRRAQELVAEKRSWLQTHSETNKALQQSLNAFQSIIELALQPDVSNEAFVVTHPEQPMAIDYQCRMRIQVLVADTEFRSRAEAFERAVADSPLQALPICFNPVQVERKLKSLCDQDRQGRIECSLKKLASLTIVSQPNVAYTHLIAIVDEGGANTRGGLMYLDAGDNEQVFLHELAHWFGFVDEYEIGHQQQQQLCKMDQPGPLGLNLFVTPKSMSLTQAEALAGRALFPANTCRGSQYQAYKFSAERSFMEFLQTPISTLYTALLLNNIRWPNVVPAAMNFAHVYRDDYQRYTAYLKLAAASGYQGAITEFSQHLVTEGKYLIAKQWLEFGAEQGGINSQLLLGHAYLEGSWLPRDLAESAMWYKKAAQQNDGFGLYFYGKCHEMGWGCIQSHELAYQYYQASAELGNPLAKRKLGEHKLDSQQK